MVHGVAPNKRARPACAKGQRANAGFVPCPWAGLQHGDGRLPVPVGRACATPGGTTGTFLPHHGFKRHGMCLPMAQTRKGPHRMNGIIYLVGLVVVVMAVLSIIGLR
jgi:hypothetical protein